MENPARDKRKSLNQGVVPFGCGHLATPRPRKHGQCRVSVALLNQLGKRLLLLSSQLSLVQFLPINTRFSETTGDDEAEIDCQTSFAFFIVQIFMNLFRLAEDQQRYRQIQSQNRGTSWIKGANRKSLGYAPRVWPPGHTQAEIMWHQPRCCGNLLRYGEVFAPLIFRRSPFFFAYKY